MAQLKRLTFEAIPAALARAEHYLLLNEPREAESICRDVLSVTPHNQEALIKLLLALSDQFQAGTAKISQAQELLGHLDGEYERWYYAGLIFERWAKSQHPSGKPGVVAVEWYTEAMRAFEKAEAVRPPGNDDAILRWNFCVRSIRADEYLKQKFSGYSLADEGHPAPS